MKFKFV